MKYLRSAGSSSSMDINSKNYYFIQGDITMNATCTPERLQSRLDLRSSNAARPHKNKHRDAKRGGGKGGRGAARRAACTW